MQDKIIPERIFSDIHSHILINMRYLRKDLNKWVKPPKFYNPLRNQIDAKKLKHSPYGICVFNIYAPFKLPPGETYLNEFRRQTQMFKDFVERHNSFLSHTKNYEEVEKALSDNKIACILAIEGGHIVENLSWLEEMKKEGLFYITLVHFIERKIGTTYLSVRKNRVGLKPFGRELLKEMKNLGIVPDIAHGSERLMNDVLEAYDGPVIFSHTGARKYVNSKRNIPDSVAKEIFKRKGLVGIIYCTYYMKKFNLFGDTNLIADTAEHFISLGGEDFTCIGSDMDGFIVTPSDLKDITQTPNLINTLTSRLGEQRAFKISFDNVKKFLERNFH